MKNQRNAKFHRHKKQEIILSEKKIKHGHIKIRLKNLEVPKKFPTTSSKSQIYSAQKVQIPTPAKTQPSQVQTTLNQPQSQPNFKAQVKASSSLASPQQIKSSFQPQIQPVPPKHPLVSEGLAQILLPQQVYQIHSPQQPLPQPQPAQPRQLNQPPKSQAIQPPSQIPSQVPTQQVATTPQPQISIPIQQPQPPIQQTTPPQTSKPFPQPQPPKPVPQITSQKENPNIPEMLLPKPLPQTSAGLPTSSDESKFTPQNFTRMISDVEADGSALPLKNRILSAPPDQLFEEEFDQEMLIHPKTRRGLIFWFSIILITIAVAGLVTYYFLIGSGKKISISGNDESLTFKIPGKFETTVQYEMGVEATIIFDPKVQSTKDVSEGKLEKTFMALFFIKNSLDPKQMVEKIKKFHEDQKSTNKDTRSINITSQDNFQQVTIQGDFKLGEKGSKSYYQTENYIVTSKSVFIVASLNPSNDKTYGESQFKKLMKSVKIEPKK